MTCFDSVIHFSRQSRCDSQTKIKNLKNLNIYTARRDELSMKEDSLKHLAISVKVKVVTLVYMVDIDSNSLIDSIDSKI